MTLRKGELLQVLKKYSSHPEFLGIELTDVNQPGAMDSTLLHIAAETGALDDMKILLESGAEINARGDMGNTPLHAAAMMGKVESVKFLIQHGADQTLKNEFDQTALNVAETGKKTAVSEILRGRHPR